MTNCVTEVRQKVLKSCQEFCRVSCNYTTYKLTSSNAKWPKKERFKVYYDALISNRPYGWRFTEAEKCHRHPENCSDEQHNKISKLLENNFAKVGIFLGDYVVTEHKDFEAITFSSFLASIGGAWNLWSGLSVCLFLECLDWLVKILMERPVRSAKSKTTNNGNVI